jgi:tRNA-2-methylthio-N6-dimethylallyladenosine synthase
MAPPRPDLRGVRFHLRTFGCQMNANDSERLAGLLAAAGGVPAETPESSDVIIVNTCAVRAKSEEKLRSYLGRLQGLRRRGVLLAVVGCVAQLRKGRLLAQKPAADFVVGPDQYGRIVEILAEGAGRRVADTGRNRSWRDAGSALALRESPVSAYVTIMEGCDNFCAYCVVPFARGREKYRPMRAILDEVENLAGRGYREVQLLGQNVNTYRDPESGESFPDLLGRVGAVEGIAWIRFLTSHPKSFGGAIVEAMAASPKICRQIHLPLQAGSSAVLARMKRGYTREDYLGLVRMIRSRLPGIALSTDVIVGFPGETEDEFKETLSALEAIRFANLFSFRYSPRPLTAAAKIPDDVPDEIKRRRLLEVQALQKAIQAEFHAGCVGRTERVLCTGRSKKDPRAFAGRNEGFQVVNFRADEDCLGRFVEVSITSAGPFSLRGELAAVA